MFEKFSDRARRVVVTAQEVARGLQHDFIGTEHLLIALAELEGSVSQKILFEQQGYTLDTLREQITLGEASAHGHLPFTPRATRALEYARRESLQRSSTYVDDIDILLGIVRPRPDEQLTTAAAILTKVRGDDAVKNLRKAIAERVENVSPIPGEMSIPEAPFIQILIPQEKVPKGGAELIRQINDNLVDYSVEDLQRILQFIKESRLRIASY